MERRKSIRPETERPQKGVPIELGKTFIVRGDGGVEATRPVGIPQGGGYVIGKVVGDEIIVVDTGRAVESGSYGGVEVELFAPERLAGAYSGTERVVADLLSNANRREIREASDRVKARQSAQTAAMRMLSLDDARWEAMSSFRVGYLIAREQGDEESMFEMVSYAVEVLQRAEGLADAQTVDAESIDWDPGVIEAVERSRAAFFDSYVRMKEASGLRTQKQVSDAAGLSPATVQAIESRKVKPQYRTVEKLARAFGCSVTDLLGETERGHGMGRDTVA